ncbi:ATP-grasp domain-containing protein [Saccharibacillus sacchari]|uniref:ATP-grasp domain-containing protein n=1 Tax=Saccharibacillus sacchari TaxID=456493 RepID=UPI0004ADD386|nr:ATP-grasp domain-containing protein [Saccharibacillus sacchari]
MKAFIQTNKDGEFYNINVFSAYEGFTALGWEIVKFHELQDIEEDDSEHIVVGGIGNMRGRLEALGVSKNKEEIDYPASLSNYFGRKIWASTLQNLFADEQSWKVRRKSRSRICGFYRTA